VVIAMLLLTLLTISGCSQKVVYVPSRQVLVMEPNDIAPYHGVLIGDARWLKIIKRLIECEGGPE